MGKFNLNKTTQMSKELAGTMMSEKSKDVRSTNITAARAVADVVRTSLGPRGMDKMIQTP